MTTSKKEAKKQYDINVKTIVAIKQAEKKKQRTPITFYVLWAFIALILFLFTFKIIIPIIKLVISNTATLILAIFVAVFMFYTILRTPE